MDKSIIARIPVLSENAALRYLTFSALYLAQGIPGGMIFFGLPAWMAVNGLSATEIGSFVSG
jgi:PAT family beta-lactamase induction signal transducer AmpG